MKCILILKHNTQLTLSFKSYEFLMVDTYLSNKLWKARKFGDFPNQCIKQEKKDFWKYTKISLLNITNVVSHFPFYSILF